MDIDQCMSLASSGAKTVHGDRARVVVEESPICTVEGARWSAAVKVRSQVVTSKRGATCGDALRDLIAELAAQSRAIVGSHRDIDFGAARLGL